MDHEDIISRMGNQKDDNWWKNVGIFIQNNELNEMQIKLDNLFE